MLLCSVAQARALLKRLLLLDGGGAAAAPVKSEAEGMQVDPQPTAVQQQQQQQQQQQGAPAAAPTSSSAFDVGPASGPRGLPCPAKLLYTLQALHALMFPASWPAPLAALQLQVSVCVFVCV